MTTDFGDAVATSERTDNGDVSTWLQTPSQNEALARLDWRADDGNLAGEIASVRNSINEAFAVAELPISEMNQLLYALWELERDDPSRPVCVGNTAVTCCRHNGWHCRAAR